MAMVVVPGVDLVADGVARERRRDAMDVVHREVAEAVGELRQIHDPHSRHKPATSWGIFGLPTREFRVNAVFPRCQRATEVTPVRRSTASCRDLAPHQTVEDVGLADTRHLVEAEGPQDARPGRSRRRRSRRPGPVRGPGCGAARDRLGGEGAEHVLGGRSRVSRKWWIASRSYSGRPSSIAATVVTVPARPTSVVASAAPGTSRRTSARWSRTTETAWLSSSGCGGSSAGTAR